MCIGHYTYTYHNDNLGSYSLIDYFLCSPKLVTSSATNQILEHGENTSDHLAIMCKFACKVCKFACKVRADDLKLNERVMSKLSWEKANLEMYKSVVSRTLADINLPLDAFYIRIPIARAIQTC